MKGKTKPGKRALCASALSVILCAAMLLGTTFAWFTDSVSSAGNRIQAGNLEIDLLMDKAGDGNYVSIADGAGDIFSEAAGNGVRWEPGKTEMVYLAVQNKGSLAVKYNIVLDMKDGEIPLADALEYAVLDGGRAQDFAGPGDWEALKALPGVQTGSLQAGRITAAPEGRLDAAAEGQADETEFFALAVHMKETAGNGYQGGSVTIDLQLVAGQAAAEADGFGSDQYDAAAPYADAPLLTGEALYQEREGGPWLSGGLGEALAGVYDGGTVRLLEDVEAAGTIEITKQVTLTSAAPSSPSAIRCDISGHGYLLYVHGDEAGVTLRDIRIDGGSEEGATASRALVAVGAAGDAGRLVLEEGAELCNNNNVTLNGAGGGLTLISGCVEMRGGSIRNNGAYTGGGAALVNDPANTFTMTGGEIAGNRATGSSSASRGGGAVYLSAGHFDLNGGSITGNTAYYGGGVLFYRATSSTPVSFSMESGRVADNTAQYGGGFYVNQCDYIALAGGSVTGNRAEAPAGFGGGLLAAPDSALRISGNVQIKGNTSAANGADNLYLDGYVSGGVVHMPDMQITGDISGAEIGVSTWLKPETGGQLPIASPSGGYVLTAADLAALQSDNGGYVLAQDGAGGISMEAAS